MKARCLVLLIALFAVLPVWAQTGDAPIVATDLLKIRQLGDVSVSPDGRQVVYTVKSIVEQPGAEGEADYAYRTHLWIVPADGSAPPRALTHGPHSATQPAWHPESDRIAFVRTTGGKGQVFVLPLGGGEAYPITEATHGASAPAWSPDGEWLLFASALPEAAVREAVGAPTWASERTGRGHAANPTPPDPDGSLTAIRAWLDENQDEGNPRVFDRLDLQGEHDLEPRPTYRHLYVVGAEGGTARALTTGWRSFGDAAWVPGGAHVLATALTDARRHPDRLRETGLFLIGVETAAVHPFLALDGYRLSDPIVAPDERHVAFLAQRLADDGYAQTELGLFTLDGRGTPELLTLDFDHSLGAPTWSREGWHLFFTAAAEGGFPLYRLDAFDGKPATSSVVADASASRARFGADEIDTRTPEISRLTPLERGIRSFGLGGATAYYVVTEPANPYELYAADQLFEGEQRLSDHNAAWLAGKRLSVPEVRFLERDSLTVDYWVMKPTFYQEGQTYPLLVEIHGGPSAMWGPGEVSMWHEFQFFAARGWAVVFANPRGSGGYGTAFRKANFQDWGHGPAGDVLAAATEVAAEPWVDATRQIVTGGSYAGYLTAWIVAHDHRFRAAAAQRGVYDLPTFLGEGNAWRLIPNHFGGYPWDDVPPPLEAADDEGEMRPTPASVREILYANSPLTFVDQIRTPLLIIHGDEDLRTGVIQSEVLYKSLKILGRPVEYARYPKAGHELSRSGDPRQRIDRILRIYEFLARHVE